MSSYTILNNMLKKIIFSKIFLFCFSIILIFILIEISLRIMGFRPFSVYEVDLKEPTTNKYDAKIGWKPKEGVYNFLPKSKNGKNTTFTILKDGSRFSGNPTNDIEGDIVVIGGSFAQGAGVNDEETFSFLLQKKIPNYKINNYGVGGYGTYQSYLLLEDIIDKKNNIKHVIYFYIYFHEDRNIGNFSWVKSLTKFSRRGHSNFPYAKLDKNGNLVKYPPIKYIELPFRKHSSIIARIEEAIMRIKLYSINQDRTKITQTIILKMKRLLEKNKIKFSVVNLIFKKRTYNSYIEFFKKNKIDGAYCTFPLTKGFFIENDGHPNAKTHKLYSNCVYDFIFN